jgi:hypothetical protein
MITEKEKIAIAIMYEKYKKDEEAGKSYMLVSELLHRANNRLSMEDLYGLILHGDSQYIGFLDAACGRMKLKPSGIAYMEARVARTVNTIAFWTFGLSAIIAAIYAVLTYYCK